MRSLTIMCTVLDRLQAECQFLTTIRTLSMNFEVSAINGMKSIAHQHPQVTPICEWVAGVLIWMWECIVAPVSPIYPLR